jgi:hypothetical protein
MALSPFVERPKVSQRNFQPVGHCDSSNAIQINTPEWIFKKYAHFIHIDQIENLKEKLISRNDFIDKIFHCRIPTHE